MYAIAYHGTTYKFKKFTLNRSLKECYFGPAIYLSSNACDSCTFYNKEGNDNKSKVQMFAETHETTVGQARRKLLGRSNDLLTCAITLKNPFLAQPGKYIEHRCGQRAIDRLTSYLKNKGYSYSDENLHYYVINPLTEGIQCVELVRNLFMFEVENHELECLNPEYAPARCMTQDILKFFGYDGVIQDASYYFRFMAARVGDYELTHYAVFNPNQIKIIERRPIVPAMVA